MCCGHSGTTILYILNQQKSCIQRCVTRNGRLRNTTIVPTLRMDLDRSSSESCGRNLENVEFVDGRKNLLAIGAFEILYKTARASITSSYKGKFTPTHMPIRGAHVEYRLQTVRLEELRKYKTTLINPMWIGGNGVYGRLNSALIHRVNFPLTCRHLRGTPWLVHDWLPHSNEVFDF